MKLGDIEIWRHHMKHPVWWMKKELQPYSHHENPDLLNSMSIRNWDDNFEAPILSWGVKDTLRRKVPDEFTTTAMAPMAGSPEPALSRPPDNGPPAGSRPRAGSRPWAGTPEPAPSGLPELAPSRLPYNGPKRSSLALAQHQPPSGKINVRPPDLTSSPGLQIPVFDLKNPASRLQGPESSFRFQLHRDNSVIFKMMTKLSTKCPGNSLAKKNGSGTSLSILG